jgi:hypothetical protein
MESATLIGKRLKAAKKIPPVEEILRGSIVVVKRYCGKANCRCLKGHKHRSMYISQSNKGESRLIYIPQRSENEVRRLIRNYQALRSVMEEISRINMRLMASSAGKADT